MSAYRRLTADDESPWRLQRIFKIMAIMMLAVLFIEYSSNQFFIRNSTPPWIQPQVIYSVAAHSVPSPSNASIAANERLKNETTSILRQHLDSNSSLCTNDTVNKLCPLVPPLLVGRMKVLREDISISDIEALNEDVELGGKHRPQECLSRHRVAIIVPYRDREEHLHKFLHNLHPMLKRQQIDYQIFIVEQAGNFRFNRAKLMNIGYLEANKIREFDCYIFHDVDLIPEDDRNLYSCPDQPRHMSVSIDVMHYKLPYANIFGGVSALCKRHMEKVNGFSNEYWGWGAEDDDMSARIRHYKLKITRYPANIARYAMLSHKKETPNPERFKHLRRGRLRYRTDGINSCKYKVLNVVFKKLYTWILVDVLAPSEKAKHG